MAAASWDVRTVLILSDLALMEQNLIAPATTGRLHRDMTAARLPHNWRGATSTTVSPSYGRRTADGVQPKSMVVSRGVLTPSKETDAGFEVLLATGQVAVWKFTGIRKAQHFSAYILPRTRAKFAGCWLLDILHSDIN
ncbi:uncharacterized protein LOC115318531 [Ixodes scapularis]|uniref:uncharacterized protein LOC115318531 n=1 Tax=Ixodes scapularis TaxID=6945 RepID=UPI001A9F814A|nr:uncharacterized protein LOC115318531 [Ixodes scapularis]